MKLLVTGSAGHLGDGTVRTLRAQGHEVVGLDVLAAETTDIVGSIVDRDVVRAAMAGVHAVVHTATLHKPHVGSHSRREFVDTNITGTLHLLEEAVAAGVGAFIFTSTTSTFGRALTPAAGEPAAWITEDVTPVPKNIYGATKTAAEDLCELVHRDHGLPCLILRTSRFFPEADDLAESRDAYPDLNLKVNELLNRRVDIQDAVDAHLLAVQRAPEIGFGRYIISATTPFAPDDVAELRSNAATLITERFPDSAELYRARGWTLPQSLDRVYVNARARRELGWTPSHDFRHALDRLAAGEDPRSELTGVVGAKGYHAEPTGVYTTRPRD